MGGWLGRTIEVPPALRLAAVQVYAAGFGLVRLWVAGALGWPNVAEAQGTSYALFFAVWTSAETAAGVAWIAGGLWGARRWGLPLTVAAVVAVESMGIAVTSMPRGTFSPFGAIGLALAVLWLALAERWWAPSPRDVAHGTEA